MNRTENPCLDDLPDLDELDALLSLDAPVFTFAETETSSATACTYSVTVVAENPHSGVFGYAQSPLGLCSDDAYAGMPSWAAWFYKNMFDPFYHHSGFGRQMLSMGYAGGSLGNLVVGRTDASSEYMNIAMGNSGQKIMGEANASSGWYYGYWGSIGVSAAADLTAGALMAVEAGTTTTTIATRGTVGADGATSQIIKTTSQLSGRTIQVIHRVISRTGEIIHEHLKFQKFLPW